MLVIVWHCFELSLVLVTTKNFPLRVFNMLVFDLFALSIIILYVHNMPQKCTNSVYSNLEHIRDLLLLIKFRYYDSCFTKPLPLQAMLTNDKKRPSDINLPTYNPNFALPSYIKICACTKTGNYQCSIVRTDWPSNS